MQCPYCAEEIKDKAVVCRHCGRDLSFFAPLLARIGSLESRLAEAPPAARSAEPRSPAVVWGVVVALLCLLWIASTFWAGFRPEWPWSPAYLPYLITGLLPPILFGFAVGRSSPTGSRVIDYLLGFPLGLVDLGIAVTILGKNPDTSVNWTWVLLVFNFGQPWIFASAVWTASSIGRQPKSRIAIRPAALSRVGSVVLPILTQIAGVLTTAVSLVKLFPGQS